MSQDKEPKDIPHGEDKESKDISEDIPYGGEIEAWTQVQWDTSQEEMRQMLTRRILRWFEIGIVLGVIIFLITRNLFFLSALVANTGLIAVAIKKILDYYFHHPKS